MRRSLLAVAVTLVAASAGAAIGLAERRAPPVRPIEAWVGTWTGPARWTGCSVEGPATVTLVVTWRDGSLWLDASGVYEGLGEVLAEVRQDGGLAYQGEAVELSLGRARKARAPTVRLETAAKCTMTATVARDGTVGIASCDGLVALAGAAATCGATVDDDPADERDAWRALTGKARTRAAAACTRRADGLREQLVTGGCIAPDDDPAALPACRDVWRAADLLLRCDRARVELKQRTLSGVADLRRSLRVASLKEGGRELATASCTETAGVLADMLAALHCGP